MKLARSGLVALSVGAIVCSGCSAATSSAIRISAVSAPVVDRPKLAPSSATPAGLVPGLPGEGLSGYLSQTIEFSDCGQQTECAEALAPLDYANPGSRAVTLAVRRKPATQKPRLGALFINPGGPGASGADFVPYFSDSGLEQYDIIGWDPRGTGASAPIRCLSDEQADSFTRLDISPDTETERTALLQGVQAMGEGCWQLNGALLEHVSTIDAARDLDLLRRLLGEEKVNYFGYSYGTRIGATYAELFGVNVGRMVLDAAVDITGKPVVPQSKGFDVALGRFADWYATRSSRLGSSGEAVVAAITGFFDKLDAAELMVGPRRLTQSLAVAGVAEHLYGGLEAWPSLADAVIAGIAGNGRPLLRAADRVNSRDENGHFGSDFFAIVAINCIDDSDQGVLAADRQWSEDQRKAPTFGKYFGPDYSCALWPVRPARQLTIVAADAPPLLVIGGTGDNATPYLQAVSMAEQMRSAVLVTYEGEGHGTFGGKSACVDQIVVDYLVEGIVPEAGRRCT